MSTRPAGIPPHFIVLVPGYMGSTLCDSDSGNVAWVDLKTLPRNPLKWGDWFDDLIETMTYPNDALQPVGVVDEVQFLLPWTKQEHYGRLLQALEDMGYRVDPDRYKAAERDVYTFPYDWRQDNRISARQLGEAIERWRSYHPGAQAWLMGHSNGGIVARWYIEKEGGKDRVGRLFLFGSPWDGAPKALGILRNGLDMMWRRIFSLFNVKERSRALVRSLPSAYHLVPWREPFLRDVYENVVDPFANTTWLSTEQERQFLMDGKRFNEDLGTQLSVETLCFFGRQKQTVTNGVVRLEAGGRWGDIQWFSDETGDGTVPERSAIHPNAHHKLPFITTHGDIYVAEPVLAFLRWELVDRYLGVSRAAVETPNLRVVFEPEGDVFEPGEPVRLWATVARVSSGAAVSRARIEVQVAWEQALAGEEAPAAAPAGLPVVHLAENPQFPGRYEGSFPAPAIEGYYRLQAKVGVSGQRLIRLRELIAVEAIPDL